MATAGARPARVPPCARWSTGYAPPLQRDYALPPRSRITIDAEADAGLRNRSFGAVVTFGLPGTAERAMFILLANPGSTAATITARFLRAAGVPVVKTFTVPPTSRFNVAVAGPGSDVPELVDAVFGTLIESTQPIVVERSVYGNADGVLWAAGTNATATPLP